MILFLHLKALLLTCIEQSQPYNEAQSEQVRFKLSSDVINQKTISFLSSSMHVVTSVQLKIIIQNGRKHIASSL